MSRCVQAVAALLGLAAAACSPGEAAPRIDDTPRGAAYPAVPHPADAAIALYERRTADDPRDHLSAVTLADLHLRRAAESLDPAEFAAAEKAARTALERQAGHPPAVVCVARALAGQGRAAEGRRMLRDLLEREPRHVGALGAAFDLALAEGDERVAEALADRLLAINEEPGTLARVAQIAARHAQTDRAVGLLHRAAADAADLGGPPSELARYRCLAGWALLAAERPEDAAREFAAALSADPLAADAWHGRAEVLAARGDAAGAVAAMTKAVAVRPTPEFRGRLAALEAAGGTR